jgi:hypothetical protein
VPTLVLDPAPAEFELLLERRRQTGADLHDEVWEGVHRIMPPPRDVHSLVQQQLSEILGPLARAARLVPVGRFQPRRRG